MDLQQMLQNYELDDDIIKLIALELSVKLHVSANQNPKATPSGAGAVLDTADKFKHWLL